MINNPQPAVQQPQVTTSNQPTTSMKVRFGLSTLGGVGGIILAVHRKSGFWGGVGWFIVGSMAGGAIGWLVTAGAKEPAVTQ